MHRNNLLLLLNNYSPSRDEASFKQHMIDFIQKYPDCFERSLAIGHITASCMLVNKQNTHALLLHHAKLGQWFQLGGHCDGNSDVLAVAIKEAQEESGIHEIQPLSETIFDIDIHVIPSNKKEQAHFHFDVRFLLQVQGDQDVIQNSESKELRWITKDITALPTNNPSVVRLFEKWVN
ncbi:MAG: NUDIX hydrolase [Candidatus Babeliales bacterium]